MAVLNQLMEFNPSLFLIIGSLMTLEVQTYDKILHRCIFFQISFVMSEQQYSIKIFPFSALCCFEMEHILLW